MHANLLHVVAVRFNPRRFKAPERLYRQFVEHMLDSGVKLHIVEAAFGERPFSEPIPHVHHINVRTNSMVFNKENLLNLGIYQLPESAKYIGCFDTDIMFRKPGWASEAVHALQHYCAIQPWSDALDLGPNDELMQTHKSFGYQFHHKCPINQGPNGNAGYVFSHPGYAWCYTRQTLEYLGGLLETAALGAADHHMAMALIGKADMTIPGNMTPNYKAAIHRWQARALKHLAFNVGYIPQIIEHSFHGSKTNRKYIERWDILARHNFDPVHDLKRNTFGVMELAGNKPGLRHDIELYFEQRNEDANCF